MWSSTVIRITSGCLPLRCHSSLSRLGIRGREKTQEGVGCGVQLTPPKWQRANEQESNLPAIPASEVLPRRATKAVPARTAAVRASEAHDFHGEHSKMLKEVRAI